MIGMLRGIIGGSREGRILVDVHGVGYLVSVRSIFDFAEGTEVTLHTHLAVRENALDLYGFVHEDELHMFEELIKLPKIGPKSALQILMQADVAMLMQAIQTADATYLSKMSGIGKKTAEKIVNEMKDAFKDEEFGGTFSHSDSDVVDALLALGYAHKDVRDAILKLPLETTETKRRITEALKILSK